MKQDDRVADFIFEVGTLGTTPRSGLPLLGSGAANVAQHTNRVCYVGWALASMRDDADASKVLKMCLLHDLAEARTSDLSHLHQQYVTVDEQRAIDDATEGLPFGEEAKALLHEYEERKSLESLIVKDADTLEMVAFEKEQADAGNPQAKDWLDYSIKQVKTDEGKKLAKALAETRADRWWRQLFNGIAGQ
jgi:5'-deoxynucleotidase YfbR-like HD superfamily hydrolase